MIHSTVRFSKRSERKIKRGDGSRGTQRANGCFAVESSEAEGRYRGSYATATSAILRLNRSSSIYRQKTGKRACSMSLTTIGCVHRARRENVPRVKYEKKSPGSVESERTLDESARCNLTRATFPVARPRRGLYVSVALNKRTSRPAQFVSHY